MLVSMIISLKAAAPGGALRRSQVLGLPTGVGEDGDSEESRFHNIDLKQHCFLFVWGEEYKEETKISTVPLSYLLLSGERDKQTKSRVYRLWRIVRENCVLSPSPCRTSDC